MPLIELNIEPVFLKRLLSIGERIADALERAYPPIRELPNVTPAGPENLIQFDAEAEWQREQEEERLRNL
ncbi:MAG TPA: hypothetical protein VGD54_07555 [Steroidobacteraceae bacterium]